MRWGHLLITLGIFHCPQSKMPLFRGPAYIMTSRFITRLTHGIRAICTFCYGTEGLQSLDSDTSILTGPKRILHNSAPAPLQGGPRAPIPKTSGTRELSVYSHPDVSKCRDISDCMCCLFTLPSCLVRTSSITAIRTTNGPLGQNGGPRRSRNEYSSY